VTAAPPPLPTGGALAGFHPAVAEWFGRAFGAPTSCQAAAWAALGSGRHTLVAAPTGSGKTLAAFLGALDALVREGLAAPLPDATRVLYVSPLKALSNDVQRNLERPLMGICDCLNEQGLPAVPIRTMVRTGDTPAAAREAMRRTPPHVLVTTPESLYILLTSEGGRRMLATVSSVIVDEIHALAGSKRGAHLALSLERLEALVPRAPVRIGLSATQKPVTDVARFLVGARRVDADGAPDCAVVDAGHARPRDLALEVPGSPLDSLMSAEVWGETYARLVALVLAHRTTLVFVNTRRLAERVAHALTERLGDENVTSHHGSLAKEQRLDAEQRLKRGDLKVLVATASLELGIDIGDVDLVCQLGSPRSIATFLQRVGRSGHAVGGTPKGRLFPLSRDDLVECTAVLEAVAGGELDRLRIPEAPLDVLAQQLVAACASEDWEEEALFERVRGAWNYRVLERGRFGACLRMLAEGFATRRGRRGAYLHRDAVNARVRARRGARLTAITNGGAIPDNADFDVVLEPDGVFLGTLNEDFAIESSPGDVFLLGNSAWRILRVESGKVRVEDAHGLPPSIPFWLGEAPGRSDELSGAVSALRARIAALLEDPRGLSAEAARGAVVAALERSPGLAPAAAEQLVEYLASGLAALGAMPDQDTVVLERFFDDSGGMQLVVHSCFGSRVNKAWGLALRKRFCRAFNFELQAAANEDCLILSLGETHSFPLADAARFLSAASVRDVLVQALLDAPVFDVRWRWNANVSLAVPRFRAGRKVPPQIQRMQAEDLVAVAFPDQIACLENLSGPRTVPDHPLVTQTIHDALTEAMDIDGLQRLLARVEAGTLRVVARDLTEPSPLAAEILTANPYAFLDDAPAEERRTRAVSARRHLPPEEAGALGRIEPSAVARVRAECAPRVDNSDELHDALMLAGCLKAEEVGALPRGADWLTALADAGRATPARVPVEDGPPAVFAVAAERLDEFRAVHPRAVLRAPIETPEEYRRADLDREAALLELARARLQCEGPVTALALATTLAVTEADARLALGLLEVEGVVLRGDFTGAGGEEWCERRLLARIHRYSLHRRRATVQPVSRSTFMDFLLEWQHLAPRTRLSGPAGLERVLSRLQGVEAPAASWESELLPARLRDFDPSWLDHLSLAGRVAWLRIAPNDTDGERGPSRTFASTPVALGSRANLTLLARRGASQPGALETRVLEVLEQHGACFFDELVTGCGGDTAGVQRALVALCATGQVNSDGFAGLRALIRPRRRAVAGTRAPALADAGRWSRVHVAPRPCDPQQARLHELELAERFARLLLERYGVLFKCLAQREVCPSSWRDLLRALRRLEARGEIRGGRFVDGFAGEQFALPAAAESLALRGRGTRTAARDESVCVAAADPVNLTGIVTLGDRIPARRGNRVLFQGGVPVAARVGRDMRTLAPMDSETRWQARAALFGEPPGAPAATHPTLFCTPAAF
jgi:ATP-dependent Lhr-like helicase